MAVFLNQREKIQGVTMKRTMKLHLSKETICALSAADLKQADGGTSFVFCGVTVYFSRLYDCTSGTPTRCEICYA